MYANRTKIHTFTAPNSQKASHYRVQNMPDSSSNCTLGGGNCGVGEAVKTTLMSVRCVTRIEPQFYTPFSIGYNPTDPTTGEVEVTVTMNETGTFTFTSAERATTDNITFTKSYSDNVTGELVSFQNASGVVTEKFIDIKNILPIATLTYDLEGPALTTGSVTANLSFNKN
jgi:hypothetical protein